MEVGRWRGGDGGGGGCWRQQHVAQRYSPAPPLTAMHPMKSHESKVTERTLPSICARGVVLVAGGRRAGWVGCGRVGWVAGGLG